MIPDSFKKITIQNQDYDVADISNINDIDKIPFSYRILIENIIRQSLLGRNENANQQVKSILDNKIGSAINFAPNRILSHDILGKVMLVDFLAYREALQKKVLVLIQFNLMFQLMLLLITLCKLIFLVMMKLKLKIYKKSMKGILKDFLF